MRIGALIRGENKIQTRKTTKKKQLKLRFK